MQVWRAMAPERRSRIAVGATIVGAAIVAFLLHENVIWSDPDQYRLRLAAFGDDGPPYVGAVFEHFPGMLVPMGAAWLLGGFASGVAFRFIFMGLMAVCLYYTADRLDAASDESNPGATRWLWVAGPLFPLVLFRSDPWVVALTAGALATLMAPHGRTSTALGWGAVVSKGWPIVLALDAWWRRQRATAGGYVALLVATATVLLVTPGFREGRDFEGIHSETIGGSFVLLWRAISGRPLELLDAAGAAYLEAPGWLVGVGALLGGAILVSSLRLLRRPRTRGGVAALLSGSTIGIMVASPLLSPQFLLWPTPFLALHPRRTVRRLAFLLNAATMVYMVWWADMLRGSVVLLALLVARNIGLVVLGFLAARPAPR
jgi:hypothetical protein